MGSNQTSPTGDCSAGHYCTRGVDTPQPAGGNHTGTGDLCPIGHYCPVKTEVPLGCAAGTYQVSVS